jgi:hypothetical protein
VKKKGKCPGNPEGSRADDQFDDRRGDLVVGQDMDPYGIDPDLLEEDTA